MSSESEIGRKGQINLKLRLLCDTAAAFGAALFGSPIIKIVDISVTMGMSGKMKMSEAAVDLLKRLILTPHKFFFSKNFAWIYQVYLFTYTANNCIDSICRIYQFNDVIPKLVGVTAINMTTSIIKDAAFVRYFGSKQATNVPLICYIIWLVRDSLSITAAFLIPERLSKLIERKKGWKKSKCDLTSQFISPMGFQIVALPIHLLGLDFYNNNTSPASERAKRIIQKYPNALPLRFVRMASAFGFGGISNKTFRNKLISRFEGKNWETRHNNIKI